MYNKSKKRFLLLVSMKEWMILKKYCFTILIILALTTTCFAQTTMPFSKGLVVDNTLQVLGVNLFGPAFKAGIRPNDKILNTSKELLYNHATYRAHETIERKNKIYQSFIVPEQIDRPTTQSVFLLATNGLTLPKIQNIIAQNPELQKIFLTKAMDANWGILYTAGELDPERAPALDYIVTDKQPSLIRLKTVMFFTSGEFNTFQLFHMDMTFEAKNGTVWEKVPSSGVLEHQFIEKITNATNL